MRSAEVVKAFPYAADGINIEHLAVGRDITLPENTFNGLEKAGYVKAGKTDKGALPAEEEQNRRLIDAIDRRLSGTSDQDLKDIIARSGTPYSGNLVHARMVFEAKEQIIREADGVEPVRTVDPNSGVTEQPLARPGEATPPFAAAVADAFDASGGEKKATTGDARSPAQPQEVDLDKMSRADLEAFAAEKVIDISAAKNKSAAIEIIKAAITASI